MQFLSTDLETTGLGKAGPDVAIEIGCVLADTSEFHKPLYDGNKLLLPTFRALIHWDDLPSISDWTKNNLGHLLTAIEWRRQSEHEVLGLNEHSDPQQHFFGHVHARDLGSILAGWLNSKGVVNKSDGTCRMIAAGKNFASFDARFLERTPNFHEFVTFLHRTLDPTMLFMQLDDQKPPDLAECLQRAGICRPVTHSAVQDALDVVQLLRVGMGFSAE